MAPAFCVVAIVGAHRESPNLGKPVVSGEIAERDIFKPSYMAML
jgi:hypothetical protein